MILGKEQQRKLVDDAVEQLGIEGICKMVMPYVDTDRIAKELEKYTPHSWSSVIASYVCSGFVAGMYFTMDNLEINTEEKAGSEE